MKLSKQQEQLLTFVKEKHGDQQRKYTGEPYWHHLLRVAEIVSEYVTDVSIEVALCHDLLEDTECSEYELRQQLKILSYDHADIEKIIHCVIDLTDVYISKDFPHLNRRQRKEKEAERLGRVAPLSQSVKYADLIDNSDTIMPYDKKFGRIFLKEKARILSLMREGNSLLLARCESQVFE